MDSDDEIPQLVEVAPAMPPVGKEVEDIPVCLRIVERKFANTENFSKSKFPLPLLQAT